MIFAKLYSEALSTVGNRTERVNIKWNLVLF